jgi:hypothetical protein
MDYGVSSRASSISSDDGTYLRLGDICEYFMVFFVNRLPYSLQIYIPLPTDQPHYSTEQELAKAHLGLAYMAIGKILKDYLRLVVGLHPVLVLELVKLGLVHLSTYQNTPLEDQLRNPLTSRTGKEYNYLYSVYFQSFLY